MRVRLNHKKLAEIIARSPLSQNRWAQKLSLSRGHLSDLINDRHVYPSPRTRHKILQGLGVEFDELFTLEMPRERSITREADSALLFSPPGVNRQGNAMIFILWEIRKALRGLTRQPLFAVTVFSTLALGLGLNATVFTLINGMLLEPLPFPGAERIVVLTRPGDSEADVSILDGRDLREGVAALESLALFIPFRQYDLVGDGEPILLPGTPIEKDYFEVLGIVPVAGRFPNLEEHRPSGPAVAVISDGLWERVFARSAQAIGASLTLSESPFTIIGVAPPEIALLTQSDLWIPIAKAAPETLNQRGTNNLEAIARLLPDASLETAVVQIDQISRSLAEAYPTSNRSKILTAVPLQEFMVQNFRSSLWLLQAAVVLVLLIICVNLASLQLVRSTRQQSETALRLALGGTRANLIVRPLTEALTLGGAGAVGGYLLARAGVPLLTALSPVQLPLTQTLFPSPRVLWMSALCAVIVSILIGLAPALLGSSRHPGELLRVGMRRSSLGRQQRFMLNSIAVAEITLAFLLVVGAGLIARTLMHLQNQEMGFESQQRLVANLVLPTSRYGQISTQSQVLEAMLERLEARPEIESAAFIIGAPLARFGAIGNRIRFRDRPEIPPGETPGTRLRPVLGPYFKTASIQLLRGRRFSVADREGSPAVAIINQRAAQSFWPDKDPIGKEIAIGAQGPARWMTVVGVVADVKSASLIGQDATAFYTPYRQRQASWQAFGTFLVKHSGSVTTAGETVRRAIWEVDPALPIQQLSPVETLVEAAMSREIFVSWLLGVFALVATLIALQGVYAVLSFRVAEQSREIGIRKALGASETMVVRLILARGLGLVVAGLLLGILGAGLLTRFLSELLYQISPYDPITFAMSFVLLLGTSAFSILWPALRASRLSPIRTLHAN